MKTFSFFVTCILSSVILFSCQKEINETLDEPAPSILGTYAFIGLQASGTTAVEATLGTETDRTLTITSYTSKNNSGTLTFSPTTIASNNLSYEIDTTIMVHMYYHNMPEDSMEMDFQFQVPPSSATASYKMVGNDSLYFASGAVFMGGSTTQTKPGGAKIKVEGNRLYMITNENEVTTENVQGFIIKTVRKAKSTATFQKL